MKTAAWVVAALLAGCAHAPERPSLLTGVTAMPPQQIPVTVPCLKRHQIPPPPPSYMHPGLDDEKNAIAADIDLKRATEYVVKTQSIMWGCVDALEQTLGREATK